MQSFLSGTLFWLLLKWAIIVVFWIILAAGVYRQHASLRKLAQKQTVQIEIVLFFKAIQERQQQLTVLLLLLIVVIAVNDFHPEGAAFSPMPAAPQPADTAAAAPAKISADPMVAAYAKDKGTPGLPFSEITAFNEQNSNQEAYIDWLKRRYESWLVTYYYLQKCGQAPLTDLAAIQASLHKELQSAHGENTDEQNILLAARGSFTEMYQTIPCDKEHFGPTKTSYDLSMKQIRIPQAATPAPSAAAAANPAMVPGR